jgi:hypothetical protein
MPLDLKGEWDWRDMVYFFQLANLLPRVISNNLMR